MMSAALLRRAVVQHVHQISSLRSHVHASQTRGSLHSIALQCHSFGGSRQSVSVRRMQRPLSETNVRRFTRTSMIVQSSYTAVERGEKNTMEYRIYLSDKSGNVVSPWHDIPLFTENGLLSFVCEIPKETSAKMEVATDEENTPIKQDIKKEKLRFYPYNINWNYGLLPQTWEDPDVKNAELDNVSGDNDPVDVVEIGSATLEMGGVYAVKPLGVYAMIDDGELDWKVIAINVDDPKADRVNDVEDVEREFPGELEKIMIWFRDYKKPDGKPANAYGYGAKCMNREFCMEVVNETNEFWKALKAGSRVNSEDLSLV